MILGLIAIYILVMEGVAGGDCPEGWLAIGANCHVLVGVMLSSESARTYCREVHGAHLGLLEDEQEIQMLQQHLETEVYLEPRIGPASNCSVLSSNGELSNGGDCSEQRGVLCSLTKVSCPGANFVKIQNMCYYYQEPGKNYEVATRFCGNYLDGSLLPVIRNSIQNGLIAEKLGQGPRLIGLRFRKSSKTFRWSDGSTLGQKDYSNWWNGVGPNVEELNDDDCVVIKDGGSWHVEKCSQELNFICQMVLVDGIPGNCDSKNFLQWIENPGDGMCYVVLNSPQPRESAAQQCAAMAIEANKGSLLAITSPKQQSFLDSHFPRIGYSGTYWSGMGRVEEVYTWLEGSPYGYMNWGSNEPSYDVNRECSSLPLRGIIGKWRTESCDEKLPFICQAKGRGYVEPYTPPTINDCPIGWIRGESQCFFVSSEPLAFNDAGGFCKNKAKGSTLALLKSKEVIDGIEDYIRGSSYLIGLQKKDKYMWIDGSTAAADNLPWANGEPNNPDNNKNCVLTDAGNGWKSISCTEAKPFICSMEYTVCPPDWHLFNNRCFYISKELMSCEKGSSLCKKLSPKASLSSIHSVHENDFIKNLNHVTVYNIWIGMEKNSSTGQFDAWTDGSTLNYLNFLSGHGEAGKKECVRMNTNGYWVPDDAEEDNLISCSLEITHYMNCPSGWTKSRESCYLLLTQELAFKEAQGKCKEQHGYLAQVRREEANDFIYAEFGGMAETLWIGASASEASNYFLWADGTPLSYSKWNARFPVASEKGSCVRMNNIKEGRWENVDCGSGRAIPLCERPIQISDLPQEHDVGCKEGQIAYESNCYEIFKTKGTYKDVQIKCRYDGGQVVSIENERIQKRLIPFIFKSGSNFYTSLKYYAGGWIWDYGDVPLKGFAFWAPNEPNTNIDDPEGLCVEMIADNDVFIGQWKTVGCSKANEALCQYKREGYTSPAPTKPPKPTPGPGFKCPPEYTMIQNQCYKYINDDRKTFKDARISCEEFGGDLPSFSDLDEEMEVHRHFTEFGFPNTYIGLIEHAGLSGFRWLDSSIPYGTYTNWYSNEPDCPNYELNCVFIQNSGWACGSCQEELNYICQVAPSDKPFTSVPVPPTSSSLVPCDPSSEDDGWFMIPQYSISLCYKFSGVEDKTWFEARNACQEADPVGDLASIHASSENEYLWIHYMKSDFGYSDPWIGLNSLNDKKEFRWSDGSVLDFDNWKEGEPSDHMGMESCALLYLFEDGLWNDHHCGEKRGYICQKSKYPPSTQKPSPTPTPKGHCPAGEGEFEGHCYSMPQNNNSLSWEDAHKKCGESNAELVSIHNNRENAFVLSHFLTFDVWIGATDQHEDKTFSWSDETPFDFANWGVDQPQSLANGEDKDCVLMMGSSAHFIGSWANDKCSLKKPYICKSKVDPKIPSPSHFLPPCSEASDFMSYHGNCYRYFGERKSWHSAKETCRYREATLVSIHDIQTNGLFSSLSNSDSWIGLSSYNALLNFSLFWDDSSLYDFANFKPDEVIDPEQVNCVQLNHTSGEWSVKDCQTKNSFFCQTKKSGGSIDPSAITTCPPFPGWVSGPKDHCFMFQRRNISISHEKAKLSCMDFDGHLAGIHTPSDNDWIVNNLPQDQRDEGNWMGVFRVIDETGQIDPDVFHWNDGEPYLGKYTNWASDGLGKDGLFGEILPSSGKWKLVPDMTHRNNFICSAKKVIPTQPPVLPTKNPPYVPTPEPPIQSISAGAIIGSIFAVCFGIVGFIGIVYFLEKRRIIRLFSRARRPTYSVRDSSAFSNAQN